MKPLVRSTRFPCAGPEGADSPLLREWLVTNGLGGYATGTISGVPTRRYHGLLIAALPAPWGRTMMLNRLAERVGSSDGPSHALGLENLADPPGPVPDQGHLAEFRLECGLPVWRYELPEGYALEKRLVLTHLQNTVYLTYHLVEGSVPLTLILRPSVHFRAHDASVGEPHPGPYRLSAIEDRYELGTGHDLPPLRMHLRGEGAAFTLDMASGSEITYRVERNRGYDSTGDLWSPGFFRVTLAPGADVSLVASTESWEQIDALGADEAERAERSRRSRLVAMAGLPEGDHIGAELTLAADQFLIKPAGRVEDATRAQAAGEEVRTVIAGYHWFTDWGRDTMISLEGLTLTTGRLAEAGYILRTFAYYIRDGLIPNMFPEGRTEGLYHTADATLWFFHAIDRYLAATGDLVTLDHLLPKLLDIVDCHLRSTRFGIGVDPRDGLLRQGEPGYQLTWMDAKVDDWVVTPRRGKAVEINALWYNALRLLEGWVRERRGESSARPLEAHAERARQSFNLRFWYAPGGYLYDVVDGEQGDDPACRPNQLLAISLRHPVLDPERWGPVVAVARDRLLTPFGLRSLAPGHPDYKSKYDGDLRARDAAYHQGTVWAWLIGPFIDAWLKLHPGDTAAARRLLEEFLVHLDDDCVGTASEIFDAEPPYTPRGCIAQAWSVAEVLRCWVKTAGRGEDRFTTSRRGVRSRGA
jgi:predicted glycogen debranching enzyme